MGGSKKSIVPSGIHEAMPMNHAKEVSSNPFYKILRWFLVDFLGIVREMRWSYVPPLMVYLAAGVSSFTGIIESFFVKEQLGLSAEFLAGLGFWAGLPWALKMPLGHLVDLYWRWNPCLSTWVPL